MGQVHITTATTGTDLEFQHLTVAKLLQSFEHVRVDCRGHLCSGLYEVALLASRDILALKNPRRGTVHASSVSSSFLRQR